MLRINMQQKCKNWLIADVGATSSRFAIYDGQVISAVEIFRNDDFNSLETLATHYVSRRERTLSAAAMAVAAPIDGNDVQMINRNWTFSRNSIAAVGFNEVRILNDFHAIAYALPTFGDDDRFEVGTATQYRRGNIAVLGPGSGLGMSAWIAGNAAMCGEGGHITLSGRDAHEDEIIAKLRDRFGHASAERALSGPGIVALHEAMHGELLTSPEEIAGNTDTDIKRATMAQFYRFLGSAAAELALIAGAIGGIYIAGGIVPSYTTGIANSEFRERFEEKNRYRDYMAAIPTYVITDPVPGLTGLATFVDRDSSASL